MVRIIPLGDQGALCYLDQEDAAAHLAAAVRQASPSWLIDVVQAYRSVGVFFDLNQVCFESAADFLHGLERQPSELPPGKLHHIPCCYEFALDLERIAAHAKLTPSQIIELHSGTIYTVYAIGFCPGFPYLGYLPPPLTGVPRLQSPRLRLEAGSVGLTGRQTGIYTEPRPGGWNIVGRTPLELVHVRDGYFPLRTGDRVQFVAIGREEFEQRKGQRL